MTVTPERLREYFAPRSLAVVGASDTSYTLLFFVLGTYSSYIPT